MNQFWIGSCWTAKVRLLRISNAPKIANDSPGLFKIVGHLLTLLKPSTSDTHRKVFKLTFQALIKFCSSSIRLIEILLSSQQATLTARQLIYLKSNMDDQANLLKQVSVTTNKALVLSTNGSRGSPTNGLSDNSTGTIHPIMNTVTVNKLLLSDLDENLNSDSDLNNFLDLIEISRSLPFTKSSGTLEDDEEDDEKFQISIRVKEDANLKISSIQLLSSEEMFELHCGETNEYIRSVYCDFIDKVDQQFVIYYGCQSLVKNLAGSSLGSLLRSESSLRKSLNIVFPKFNSSVKDTIWIFSVKLNLVECRSTNFNSRTFNSMSSMLPFMQMFAKSGNDPNKLSNFADLLNNLVSKSSESSSHSPPQCISQLLPNDSSKDFLASHLGQLAIDVQNNQMNRDPPPIGVGDVLGGLKNSAGSSSKPKVSHQRKRKSIKTRAKSNDLILKKLIGLEQKMNLIDQKLSDLRLEISSRTN